MNIYTHGAILCLRQHGDKMNRCKCKGPTMCTDGGHYLLLYSCTKQLSRVNRLSSLPFI